MTTTHKKLLTKAQAIEVFNGKVTDLAEALGLTRQAIYAWDERAIPERHDMKIRYELHPKKNKKDIKQ